MQMPPWSNPMCKTRLTGLPTLAMLLFLSALSCFVGLFLSQTAQSLSRL
uniref:Uncharacterized protein n=1 Tax=Mus musculus TaxID=10090 RepID=Q3UN94_MOUSE|nr:unnamed protein product [Mus musculus]